MTEIWSEQDSDKYQDSLKNQALSLTSTTTFTTHSNSKQTDSKKSTNNTLSERKQKQCGFKRVQYNQLLKHPSMQTNYVVYGDLMISLGRDADSVELYTGQQEFDRIQSISESMQNKKNISFISLDHSSQLLEAQFENCFSGIVDTSYLQHCLINSSNSRNYAIAQQLNQYQQIISPIRQLYEDMISGVGYDNVMLQYNHFVKQQRDLLVQQMQQEGQELYSYVCTSFVNEYELGFPVQTQQGSSQGIAILFGGSIEFSQHLINRFGFIEELFKRGFSLDLKKQEVFNKMLLMFNLNKYAQIQELFNENIQLLSIDGIFFNAQIQVFQKVLCINSLVIGIFYYSTYQIDSEQLLHVIHSRNLLQSENNQDKWYMQQNNLIDLIKMSSLEDTLAMKFHQYISNDDNFRPPKLQDLFPTKTCKIRNIKEQQQQNISWNV